MGIRGLTKLLSETAPKAVKEQTLASYSGRKIAIDASMSIYQFLIVVGRSGTRTLTNQAGKVTSHLQGMLSRTIRLLEAGLKPVFVFDGQPPDLKRQEIAKRFSKREDAAKNLNAAIELGDDEGIEKFSKRTVMLTKKHNEDCKKLLRMMGVPVIQALSEAEAECATLCKNGKVYAMASEDMDSLTFGAPRFLRHLMDPSSKKIPVLEFEVAKVLEELEFTMDQFIDLCILCGCDYCEGIKGIGGKTALKLIRQHGSMETVLENINRNRYQIPEDWPYQEARHLFKEPPVSNNSEELNWTAPDEEGLMIFLVNENGFNKDRIVKSIEKIKATKNKSSQEQLKSNLKPAGSTSLPLKLKRCGKSCRLRWINYLRPDLKRGTFSEQEENLIIELHARLGNRWSQIAAQLPGRTDNEIKNLWNSSIKKKLRQSGIDPNTHKPLSEVDKKECKPTAEPIPQLIQVDSPSTKDSIGYFPECSVGQSTNQIPRLWFNQSSKLFNMNTEFNSNSMGFQYWDTGNSSNKSSSSCHTGNAIEFQSDGSPFHGSLLQFLNIASDKEAQFDTQGEHEDFTWSEFLNGSLPNQEIIQNQSLALYGDIKEESQFNVDGLGTFEQVYEVEATTSCKFREN